VNTNKKQKNPLGLIIVSGIIFLAVIHKSAEIEYAKICGSMGEMELSALRTQRFVAESGGDPISEEDRKRLSFLATERRYGCN
jgi:predicted alpha/beta hydrolase family esterase